MRRLPPVPAGARVVRVTTPDGVVLSGIAVPACAAAGDRPAVRRPTFVLAHGFTNSVDRAPCHRLVGRIAPTPLLLVHGDRDSYFPREHFRTLARAAGAAATVWVVAGTAHAESGMTAPLAERIGRWAVSTLGDTPGPDPAVPACAGPRAATSASIGG